jgi:hypothetical protein
MDWYMKLKQKVLNRKEKTKWQNFYLCMHLQTGLI